MTRIATALITLAAAAAFALGLGTSTSLAAVPPVPWAAQVSGSGGDGDYGYGVSALPDGSSIVTGGFSGTVTFGSTTLTSVGGQDIFFAKLNRSGSYVWATQAGGSGYDAGYGVSALPDGSSIVTGYFHGTATFGSTTLTAAGRDEAFVAKVSPTGSFEWATRVGGAGWDYGYGVSVLPDGSAIVTGFFEGTATFGSTTLTTTRGDAFVAKVNPEGSFAWAKQIGSASGSVYGMGLSVLTDGSVIVTGAFQGTATFGSISLTSAGDWDNFITKLDSSGSFVWANRAGGTLNDFGGYSVSALPDGSAIYTGRFRGTATFGSTTLTAAGDADIFVAKVDASGSFVWATQAGGSAFDTGYGVTALPDGSSIVTGWFSGTATFGSNTFTAAGNDDIFVAKVSPSGSFVWSMQAGASAGGGGLGATSLVDGSVFVTGYFNGTATFGSIALTSAGQDGFVAKFLDAPQAPAAPRAVAGDGQATVTITPLAGGSVTTYTVLAGPGGQTCTITAPATSCIVTGLTNGTRYTFTATATNATGTSPASAASNAVTPTGTTPQATTTTTLRPTVLPSRTRITSGQSMRLGIRTTNTGSATASSVTSCITLPANLVVIRTGGATRSGRTLCFSLGDLPAGATRTNALTVRAVAIRSVIRRVSATTRSASASPAPTTARSAPIRISPRAARARVTG